MCSSEKESRMEGWLYLIRTNRVGLRNSRKRYFVLQRNSLDYYRAIPKSNEEDPVRSAVIDSCIHVQENGGELMNKNTLFMFTLYNALNHNYQLKLGATSSEEAARWIQSLREASLKGFPDKGENGMGYSRKGGRSLRLSRTMSRRRGESIDWTSLSVDKDLTASDVIASSSWTIFSCTNGLRLFKEAKDIDFNEKSWDYQPATMAVGVVDANSEAIFRTIMSLGPSRSEWDFCLSHGTIVEHLNDNTDIIHKRLLGDWLPRGMAKRDLVLQRCWRREDDGTYAIIYQSMLHPNCQPEKGYVRACLKSGGYVISPVNQGKQSVVRHMLAIDWKSWRSYLFGSSGEYITIRMLTRVAALREFFQAKNGSGACSNYSSRDLIREIGLTQSEKEDIKLEVHSGREKNKNEDPVEVLQYLSPNPRNMSASLPQLSDEADEFFDVPTRYELDQSEAMWPSNEDKQSQLVQEQCHPKLPTDSVLLERMQDNAVQEKAYVDLVTASMDNVAACFYGTTLPKDPSRTIDCSWTSADPSTFLIRGESYFQDHQKIKAKSTLMELVGSDWLKSDKREDDLGGRPGGIVQKYAQEDTSKFFFIVNFQIPGSTLYSLALYYMMDSPLENVILLKSFIEGDDAYRNSRFKLIPFISKGSWIVKQSVGRKACLVGQALKLNYFQGRNYFEVDVDVGSSSVSRSVCGLVLSYVNSLVIEMAFLIQGNTQDELPEILIGTCRLNHMVASNAIPIDSCHTRID